MAIIAARCDISVECWCTYHRVGDSRRYKVLHAYISYAQECARRWSCLRYQKVATAITGVGQIPRATHRPYDVPVPRIYQVLVKDVFLFFRIAPGGQKVRNLFSENARGCRSKRPGAPFCICKIVAPRRTLTCITADMKFESENSQVCFSGSFLLQRTYSSLLLHTRTQYFEVYYTANEYIPGMQIHTLVPGYLVYTYQVPGVRCTMHDKKAKWKSTDINGQWPAVVLEGPVTEGCGMCDVPHATHGSRPITAGHTSHEVIVSCFTSLFFYKKEKILELRVACNLFGCEQC